MYEVDCTVVSYNSAADLRRCIESLQQQIGVRVAITVVDNASTDDSVVKAESLGVRVVCNEVNRGFAAAANQGMHAGTAPWVLLFNPDAVLPKDGLALLIETARSREGVGCVGPRVVDEDGIEYPSGRRFPNIVDATAHALIGKIKPNNPATRRYHARDVNRAGATQVDWVSGCCLLIPRFLWEKLGGLDEAYFMYLEDMDFSFRAMKVGYRTIFDPTVAVTHIGGRSSQSRRIRSIYHHHVSAAKFQWRSLPGNLRPLIFPFAAIFLSVRFLAIAATVTTNRVTDRRKDQRMRRASGTA